MSWAIAVTLTVLFIFAIEWSRGLIMEFDRRREKQRLIDSDRRKRFIHGSMKKRARASI